MTDFKPQIVDILTVLKNHESGFKSRAYKTALESITPLPAIKSLADVEGLKGIGEKIRLKIQEIIETGTLSKIDALKADPKEQAKTAFQNIYGVGPVKAGELAEGFESIEELRAAVKALSSIAILNDKQLIGLHYYEDLLLRIPRPEMTEHETLLRATVTVPMDVVGSFRLGAEHSGDIDMRLCSSTKKTLDAMVEALIVRGYILETLAHGDHKFMGICKLPGKPARRLDILLTPPAKYGFALLYFTGSQKYNIQVRQHALTLGYSLSEHGLKVLTARAKPVPELLTEKAIVEFMGLPFVPPEER
jgi:DNA polymerase/3'-5' exonuclease PolX